MEISSSEMRSCLISKMEERLDLSIVSSETTYTVSNTRTENDYIYLDVYEWTNVEYTGNSGLVDVFGYGVDHNMVLENYNDTYSLISDTYDEGPLTGMSSSLSNEEFFELANSKKPDYNAEQTQPDGILSEAECYSTLSTSTYNTYKVAEYANKWVNPSANGGTTYTNSYNTSEYVTNGPDGDADCTNYVSQCMYAGGMKMDSTSDKTVGGMIKQNCGAMYGLLQLHTLNILNPTEPHIIMFRIVHTSSLEILYITIGTILQPIMMTLIMLRFALDMIQMVSLLLILIHMIITMLSGITAIQTQDMEQ